MIRVLKLADCWQKIKNKPIFIWVVVVTSAVTVFWYIIPSNLFGDADPFYHLRLTTMLRDSGILREFPWTQSSLYKNIFIDHHFGYHMWLLPFISIWGDFVGIRIATIIFAAFSVATIIWCLRRFQAPWWGVAALLLLTTQPFLLRLSLNKAPSLAIAVVVVGYYLIVQKKIGWLFWYSWFFVWFYSAWPVLLVMATVYIIVKTSVAAKLTLSNLINKTKAHLIIFKNYLFTREHISLLSSILVGVVVGLVINPYFPTNIFYLQQIFGMSLKPYHEFVKIGGEWYPPLFFDLVGSIALPLLVWIISLIISIFTRRQQTELSWGTQAIAVVWFIYTLRARRQVEYLVPFLVISSMLILRDAGVKELWRQGLQKFYNWLPRWLNNNKVRYAIIVYLCVAIPFALARGIGDAKNELSLGFKNDYLTKAQSWLINNTPAKSIIFQTNWSSFAALWYYNQHNYYLTGLDQTFMYEYNSELYKQWQNTISGSNTDLYDIALNTFGASYILIEPLQSPAPQVLYTLNRDPRFKKIYSDDKALIWEIKN